MHPVRELHRHVPQAGDPLYVQPIREVNPRPVDIKGKGLGNFLNMGRAVFGALAGRAVPIEESAHSPDEYDLVVIGTPVYANSLPAPVRAYIQRHWSQFKEVAFFCTGDDPHTERVFQRMREACGKAPYFCQLKTGPLVCRKEGHFGYHV